MRKLPVLTERTLGQMKAARVELAADHAAKLPIVSCRVGCSACCSYPIFISILEGIVLYRHLTQKGHWTPSLRRKLEKHSETTMDLPVNVWFSLDLACPLLEKNKCLGYQARPFTCRTIFARSDPQHCHPHRMNLAMIVDREDISTKFREVEARLLAKHKLPLVGLPISQALLLGEKISQGEADLENFLALIVERMAEAST